MARTRVSIKTSYTFLRKTALWVSTFDKRRAWVSKRTFNEPRSGRRSNSSYPLVASLLLSLDNSFLTVRITVSSFEKKPSVPFHEFLRYFKTLRQEKPLHLYLQSRLPPASDLRATNGFGHTFALNPTVLSIFRTPPVVMIRDPCV